MATLAEQLHLNVVKKLQALIIDGDTTNEGRMVESTLACWTRLNRGGIKVMNKTPFCFLLLKDEGGR